MAKTLTDLLVDWARIEFSRLIDACDRHEFRVITARMVALRRLQKECGHDGMKLIRGEGPLWQCQCCGLLQRETDSGLRMPGTFIDEDPPGAVETELAQWSARRTH